LRLAANEVDLVGKQIPAGLVPRCLVVVAEEVVFWPLRHRSRRHLDRCVRLLRLGASNTSEHQGRRGKEIPAGEGIHRNLAVELGVERENRGYPTYRRHAMRSPAVMALFLILPSLALAQPKG